MFRKKSPIRDLELTLKKYEFMAENIAKRIREAKEKGRMNGPALKTEMMYYSKVCFARDSVQKTLSTAQAAAMESRMSTHLILGAEAMQDAAKEAKPLSRATRRIASASANIVRNAEQRKVAADAMADAQELLGSLDEVQEEEEDKTEMWHPDARMLAEGIDLVLAERARAAPAAPVDDEVEFVESLEKAQRDAENASERERRQKEEEEHRKKGDGDADRGPAGPPASASAPRVRRYA